jgi:hypothetical protein
MQFLTKGQTLLSLNDKLRTAKILNIHLINFHDWEHQKKDLVELIIKNIRSNSYIVRSSSSTEDKLDKSNAGTFLTVLNVQKRNLEESINNVFNSYDELMPFSEVLIQPMLEKVILSGVAFSHDPNTGSPYRVINYSIGPDTTLITSGKVSGKVWQSVPKFQGPPPGDIALILPCMDELLSIFNEVPLDFEFAITSNSAVKQLYLLQVRPLKIKNKRVLEKDLVCKISNIAEKVKISQKPNPFLVGDSTIFGIMPDWNPAEIIGIRPKPLALSLYRELITDSIWAYQRHNYGYRNLRSFPLMVNFYGLPYIDVRVSFNSFIPEDIPNKLANKLCNYYLNKLARNPELHDKVEFEVVFSSFHFDLDNSLSELAKNEFSADEISIIKTSLIKLTNNILNNKNKLWELDAMKISHLKKRRLEIENSNLTDVEKIYWYLEDTKRYGTLPFAGLARVAFISIQMLKSLISTEILSQDEYDLYLSSLPSISKNFLVDKKQLSMSQFLENYGHLRPGTYDINSLRYDEDPALYLSNNSFSQINYSDFEFRDFQKDKISSLILNSGLDTNPEQLIHFIGNSITLREISKFEFTKNLSEALSCIKNFGKKLGFNSEEMAYCNYATIKEMCFSTSPDKQLISQSINYGKELFDSSLCLSLPPLITSAEDLFGYEFPESSPNFITQKKISAFVQSNIYSGDLNQKIVCIPNADPGFDWLFSHDIAGLITEFGGANSHMAIRASELGLPAVIGSGKILFGIWTKSQKLDIDCSNKKVEVVL